MTDDDLIRLSAREVVRLLNRRALSPVDCVEAALRRIEAVDPLVNAVPTVCGERAIDAAKRMEASFSGASSDEQRGLAGLPILIKDLVDVADVRTTYGSPIFRDHVPTKSAIQVERIEANGGIILGKTNTPEFGAGANTFNEVFGKTLNPWNTALSCSGSSGGSAVALATGMAWLADGSDLGGSLRTPASFCSVVGLRPSPGRVPQGTGTAPFQTLAVEGPMARDVRDVALMLDTMAGFDPRDGLSFPAPDLAFSVTTDQPITLGKIGFSTDLGGITPVDSEVAQICGRAAGLFAEIGATLIEDRAPDLSRAVEVFTILRAEQFVSGRAPLLDNHRDLLKPEVIWNIEHGLGLTVGEIGWAERERAAMYARTAEFFEDHDLLVCPAAIVPPFDVDIRYIEELDGHKFQSYVDWLAITFAITLVGCPALSLPCGFTQTGLPVGLQLIGPPRGEARLLSAAAALEDRLGVAGDVPIDPRVPKTPTGA